jgi:hypothetical protein
LQNGSPFGCGKSGKAVEINALSGRFSDARPAGLRNPAAPHASGDFPWRWRVLGWRRPGAGGGGRPRRGACQHDLHSEKVRVIGAGRKTSNTRIRTSSAIFDREHPILYARNPRDPGGSRRARRANARMTCIRRWVLAIGKGQKTSNTKILA